MTRIEHGKKWRIRWADHTGKRRSEVYEKYQEAELALHRRHVEVAEIRCGKRAPSLERKTFHELADYWLETRAPKKRSGADDRSIIETHLRPTFGPLRLADLGVAQVDVFKGQRSHLTAHTLHNHLTLLISMLNAAVALGWLERAPAIKKPRIVVAEDYRYLKSAAEVSRFFAATEPEDEVVQAMYRLAVYTGFRAGELAGLQWPDVDLPRRIITVRRSYTNPTTKGGRIRRVPILDPALRVLREWRLRHPGTWVFTNRDGNPHQPSSRVFQEVLHRVLDQAGFESPVVQGRRRWYITFHGPRHTFASHWMMNGGDLFKLQKLLGHRSIDMTMRYAHLAPDAFADDYDRLPDISGGLVSGAPIEINASSKEGVPHA